MQADVIRETFLSFFEERDHLRVPSSSLVPPPEDRSVLLTTAGMQQFKPYFRGEEKPAWARRLHSNARPEFKQALRFLLKTGDSSYKPKRLRSRAEW